LGARFFRFLANFDIFLFFFWTTVFFHNNTFLFLTMMLLSKLVLVVAVGSTLHLFHGFQTMSSLNPEPAVPSIIPSTDVDAMTKHVESKGGTRPNLDSFPRAN
jgi:hypothetical protein